LRLHCRSRYGTSLYGAWVSVQGSDRPRCSAKGCRADAIEDLQWRNPALHDATRIKHWVACAEHADRLAAFLSARGFLLRRGPL
jgi:hypothetical protein